jgi:glutamine synthetase type III
MILPSVLEDLGRRSHTLVQLAAAGIEVPESLKASLQAQTRLAGMAQERLVALKAAMVTAESAGDSAKTTEAYGCLALQAQEELRGVLDQLEKDCAAVLWPMPVYREMLAPLI